MHYFADRLLWESPNNMRDTLFAGSSAAVILPVTLLKAARLSGNMLPGPLMRAFSA